MRSTSYNRGSHQGNTIPWKWIGITWGIIALLFLIRIFGSWDAEASDAYLSVMPGDQSSVYISMTDSSKSRITSEQKLFATDKSVSVELWNAIAKNADMSIDIDKWSELWYRSSNASGNIITLTKWRAWIKDVTKPLKVELKNYNINIDPGSTVLVEQNGPHSYTYAIQWDVEIDTTIWATSLRWGNVISLLKADLVSPDTNLAEWIRPIDGAILEHPIFTRNNGSSILTVTSVWSGSTSLSGGIISTGTWIKIGELWSQYIEITEPKSGILSKTNTVTVMGNLLSKDVKRVTINNVDATVSPVNETFVIQDIVLTSEIFDIVYKAYDSNNSLLQSDVLTIFWPKWASQTSTSLVPETFPVSAKDFKITFPTENPYSTTESFIKVQWTLPKNTVDYIIVNDYRLQKFIPKSGSWYYFANMQTGTMQDGLNLYNIKFYKADWTLLYTQPFTIIKESKNATVSGE